MIKSKVFNRRIISIFVLYAVLVLSIGSQAHASSYDSSYYIGKYHSVVSDSTVMAYDVYYMEYIPSDLRYLFASDGGDINVFSASLLSPVADTSGWSDNAPVIAYFEWMSRPEIMLSTSPVESSCRADSAKVTLCHEFGHYVNVRASMIKYGRCDYLTDASFKEDFYREIGVCREDTTGLPETVVYNLRRTVSCEEYYATIFASLMIAPSITKALFPASSAYILNDISIVRNNCC